MTAGTKRKREKSKMKSDILFGLLIPFLGTTAGAACVLFMKRSLGKTVERALTGFASGVMVAASV